MYNVLLLDDALEDLKSQKKKIVSKTSRTKWLLWFTTTSVCQKFAPTLINS